MCVSWAQLSGPCDRPPGCGASRSRSRVAQTPGDPESVSARRPPVNSTRAVVGGPARPTASDRAARRMRRHAPRRMQLTPHASLTASFQVVQV